MNRTSFLFYFLLFSCFACQAQLNISGKVVNGETGLPIPGASVYFNNTSIGTSSNADGEFSFRAISLVSMELIVSSVGYEILALKLTSTSAAGKYYLCQLTLKEERLKEVLILSDARKRQWLTIFKENFLGLTQEAAKSNIVNTADIYFTRGENNSTFNAYADTPLVIINNMLGYKIYFQLIEFSFSEAGGITYFYGYTRYEELGDKNRWIKKRKDAYFGSTLHFYRALISDRLSDEGYDIYGFKSTGRKDSLAPPGIPVNITASQIVSVDSADTALIRITTGKLMVQYRRNPASKNYLARRIFFLEGSMRVGVRSFIVLNDPYFLIDHNGILQNPLSVSYTGYWTYERAANLLPYNYQPE